MDKFTRIKAIVEICEAIDEVVEAIGGGNAAKRLLLGTAMAESGCEHTTQIGGGPARGYWQMEPDTARDIYRRFLLTSPQRQQIRNQIDALRAFVGSFTSLGGEYYIGGEIGVNTRLACALARVRYMYDPDPIPTTTEDQAVYWKRVYNTEAGAGTVEEYVEAWDIHRCEEWCGIMGWDLGYA